MIEPQKNKIFVYNIPPNSTRENLLKLFSKCGKIENIAIKKNYAFIDYVSPKAVEDAIRNFNNITYYGIKINVYHSNHINDEKKINKSESINKNNKKHNFVHESHSSNKNKNLNINKNTHTHYIQNNLNSLLFKNRKRRFAKRRKSPNRSFDDSSSDEDIF